LTSILFSLYILQGEKKEKIMLPHKEPGAADRFRRHGRLVAAPSRVAGEYFVSSLLAPQSTETAPLPHPPAPRLLDHVRTAIRLRHYSLRTEDTYVQWIKRFMLFHGQRHPAEMGETEISQFLSMLAVEQHVSASTQNQALNAVLFLYRHVLDLNPGWIDNVVRAKQPQRRTFSQSRGKVKDYTPGATSGYTLPVCSSDVTARRQCYA